MLIWTAAGIAAFLIWARTEHSWPFGSKEVSEEFPATGGLAPATARRRTARMKGGAPGRGGAAAPFRVHRLRLRA